jgi:hypothetical protein
MDGCAHEAVEGARPEDGSAVRDPFEAARCSLHVGELDQRHGLVCAGTRPKPQSLPSTT